MKLLKETIINTDTEILMNKVAKALNSNKLYPDIWPIGKNSFAVFISWGDWKHDHLYADKIIEDTLNGIDFSIEKEITEEDGSDTYSAIHNVTIYPLKANLNALEEDIDTMPSMEHTLYVLHNIIDWERDYSPKDLSDIWDVAAACHIYDPDYSTREFIEAIEYYDLFDDEGNVTSELNEELNKSHSKILRENYGESDELDTFIYQLQKRFNPYYVVSLKLNGKISNRYFAYEDAAKEYYDGLKLEAENDTLYYDGADIALTKVDLVKNEDEIESILIDESINELDIESDENIDK